MSLLTSFFAWFEGEPEDRAKRIYAECPSRAAKTFYEDPPYGIRASEVVHVRNIDGRPFKYTVDQLYEGDNREDNRDKRDNRDQRNRK